MVEGDHALLFWVWYRNKCWVKSSHVNYLNVNFTKFGLLISAKQNVCHPVKTHGKN